MQAFLNTISLSKLTFFIFGQGESSKHQKLSHLVDFDWEKCIKNGLGDVYLGFDVCQIQWHRFQVSTISSSWKIKILGDK